MNAITFDTPLLFGSLLWLLWLRLFAPAYRFQLSSQLVGTLWAQYPFMLSWSLAKLVPILSATTWYPRRIRGASLFMPFIVYTIAGGLVSSFFWNVPSYVSYLYGEGRLWVQFVTFLSLVLCTRAYAAALLSPEAPLLMWKVIVSIGIIHGLAFLYQYLAAYVDLPLIGISRAHGLTLDGAAGDLAAYSVGGIDILRPGGLAGEPKTVAVLFGVVLVMSIVCGNPIKQDKKWNLLYKTSIALSGSCFVAAFSTSAYVGLLASVVGLVALGFVRFSGYVKIVVIALLSIGIVEFVLAYKDLPTLTELFSLRFYDRIINVQKGAMDPPVEAALQVLTTNPLVLLFGTGIGGGTFYLQDYLKTQFEYAFAPNIGGVHLLLEHGLIGTLLFLGPVFLLLVKVRLMMVSDRYVVPWEWKFIFGLSVSSMMFMLSGSGIAMGYPLAIGSLLGIVNIQRPIGSGNVR